MCSKCSPTVSFNRLFLILAVILGTVCGFFSAPYALETAELIQLVFQKLIKLVSIPVIFLSIFKTILNVSSKNQLKWLFSRSLFYTFLTTVLAAIVAYSLLLLFKGMASSPTIRSLVSISSGSYMNYLKEIVPEHAFQPFMTGNVLSTVLLAVLLSLSFQKVAEKEKVEKFSEILLDGLMKLVSLILKVVPLIVFSSIVLAFKTQGSHFPIKQISYFMAAVVGANLVQGIIILPAFLIMKGLSPLTAFKGYYEALCFAFLTKSSVATLPVAKRCAEENLGVRPLIANFTFPIFTTINMNGCAAFIFTALYTGMLVTTGSVSLMSAMGLIVLSVVAAIGNAGVPMGCYFLSTALLSTLGFDLNLIGLILPLYSLIDMLETSLNVWSDGVITLLINQEEQKRAVLAS
jgi:Na+/H+-dicarboxylate symporter